MSSGRLTKILQEKAETLKKRRQQAESITSTVNDRVRSLKQLQIELPETATRDAALKDLVRRSEWDLAETSAKEFLAYIEKEGVPLLEQARAQLAGRLKRLGDVGAGLPPEVAPLLDESTTLLTAGRWNEAVDRLLAVEEGIRGGETSYQLQIESEVRRVGQWAGEPAEKIDAAIARVKPLIAALSDPSAAVDPTAIQSAVEAELAGAVARRVEYRRSAEGLNGAARELGVPTASLEESLQSDSHASVLRWPDTAASMEVASEKVGVAVRERVQVAVRGFAETLHSLQEEGVDVVASRTTLEEIQNRAIGAPPRELSELLSQARAVTEEPVLTVVAGLLDEVRPRLVEARRLGRNASEVLAAMNRAREALRLRLYGEALAASHEAVDRSGKLTEDLEAAREELDALQSSFQRLSKSGIEVEVFPEDLVRIRGLLDRTELVPAQEQLAGLIRRLGTEAHTIFRIRLEDAEQLVASGRELGFGKEEVAGELTLAKQRLESGDLVEAGESVGHIEVELRAAATPYVTRRIEEISSGLDEIPDSTLIAPVKRLLADADVTLRVKDDLKGSLALLRRAEREFSGVFAQHASLLVEQLEAERRNLEEMGGAGEEIRRQIDEVRQIFNTGGFIQAFRASQEIRTHAAQQQLLRTEEAISHAKLAVVELNRMGLDVTSLRREVEVALETAREGQHLQAFRAAQTTELACAKLKVQVQSMLARFAEVNALRESAKAVGVPVDALAEPFLRAQESFQSRDFARAQLITDEMQARLEQELRFQESRRLVGEIEALAVDGQTLGMPPEMFTNDLEALRGAVGVGDGVEGLAKVRAAHVAVIQRLRPTMEEGIRALERDVEIARNAELDVSETVEKIAEARHRLAEPVPLGAAASLEAARERFSSIRGFLEQAERSARRVREDLDRAELLRVDVKPFRPRLEKVESHLVSKDYARAIDLSTTLEREIVQATHRQVSKVLANFQGGLARARREGAVTTVAENLLEQAHQKLETGEPMEAIQLAARSEGELERVELQVQIAQSSFDLVARRHSVAGADGLVAADASQALAAARVALEAKQYATAIAQAIEAGEALGLAMEFRRRARDALEAAERQVKEAADLGGQVADLLSTLEDLRRQIARGEYIPSIGRSRELGEAARWAIERLYAGPLSECRDLVEIVRSTGTKDESERLQSELDGADSALKVRDWKRATEALARVKEGASEALDLVIASTLRSVAGLYDGIAPPDDAERVARREAALAVEGASQRRDYIVALERLREEEARIRERAKSELLAKVMELQERVWIGEKLGLDTTPVMEAYGEAKLAIEGNRLEPVPGLVKRGRAQLDALVQQRLEERLAEVESELSFAREGLHVMVGSVPERIQQARELVTAGATIEAARSLLDGEEELNRRKALHRELLNLHYLVDGALLRAAEHRLDTAEARRLLEDSIRAHSQDYSAALEKARASLEILHRLLEPYTSRNASGTSRGADGRADETT
ncbi:MAG: hypothetical protein L3K03_07665 [Thermoplasmata archaeon]|nr:hypothetical protein [Thermoplasmata archaeon]